MGKNRKNGEQEEFKATEMIINDGKTENLSTFHYLQ